MSPGQRVRIWTHPFCKDCIHVATQDKTADVYPACEWDAVLSLALMQYALFYLIGFAAP